MISTVSERAVRYFSCPVLPSVSHSILVTIYCSCVFPAMYGYRSRSYWLVELHLLRAILESIPSQFNYLDLCIHFLSAPQIQFLPSIHLLFFKTPPRLISILIGFFPRPLRNESGYSQAILCQSPASDSSFSYRSLSRPFYDSSTYRHEPNPSASTF